MRAFILTWLVLLASPYSWGGTLDEQLQGRWRQVAYRLPVPNGDYQANPDDGMFYKVYGHGYYNMVYAYRGGRADIFYGGRYEVLNENEIVETIDYYGPYKELRFTLGQQGQGIIFNGKSMVGAKVHLTIILDNGELIQRGVFRQNPEVRKISKSFGDKTIDYKYQREETARSWLSSLVSQGTQ